MSLREAARVLEVNEGVVERRRRLAGSLDDTARREVTDEAAPDQRGDIGREAIGEGAEDPARARRASAFAGAGVSVSSATRGVIAAPARRYGFFVGSALSAGFSGSLPEALTALSPGLAASPGLAGSPGLAASSVVASAPP